MKHYYKLFVLACGIFIIQSCSTNRTLYIPNHQNVSQLEEKGELVANLTFTNYQLAYAITDHIGIMANAHFPNFGFISEALEDTSGDKNYFEGGIGYFRQVNEIGTFEIFAGVGHGLVSFENSSDGFTMNKFSTRFERYFIQPSIGWKQDRYELAFSLRYSYVNFYDTDLSEYVFDPEEGFEDLNLARQNPFHFVDPAVTFKAGNEFGKLFIQLQRSNQWGDPDIRNRSNILGFGVSLNITNMLYPDE